MSSPAEMDDPRAALFAEQLKHAHTLLKADLDTLRAEQSHFRELTDRRFGELESARGDHETRLRAAADGVLQFKVYTGLANGASGLLALLALLKAYILGG